MIKGNLDSLLSVEPEPDSDWLENVPQYPGVPAPKQGPVQEVHKSNGKGNVDFSGVLEKAMELFKEQAQMGTDGKLMGLAEIELSEARANAFLNAITNTLSVSHLTNLAEAEGTQFKRRDEMSVYNPMLHSFAVASHSVERRMDYVARQMGRTMDRLEDYEAEGVYLDSLGSLESLVGGSAGGGRKTGAPTTQDWESGLGDSGSGGIGGGGFSEREYVNKYGEVKEFEPGRKPNELMLHLDGLQYLFDKTLGNMSMITTSIDKLVQSERYSGSRPWGNSRAGIPSLNQPSGAGRIVQRLEKNVTEAAKLSGGGSGSGADGGSGARVREIGMAELGDIILRQQQMQSGSED